VHPACDDGTVQATKSKRLVESREVFR
jgi:hypothetical protein